jgi:HSP20 family molecular chaperone IbpA
MANGKHNGARSGDVYEDDIVLALAKKIQEANTNDKIKIILTRNDDNIIGLKERVALAEKVKADLFISLHVNAVPSQMSVTIGNDNRKDGMEISVSNKNTLFQKQSELFGSVLQQQLQTIYKTFPTLIKRKVGVWVMDQNICPSVLVECGFITNDKDRAFLTQNKNQELVAQKILAAIQQYSVIGKNDVQKQFTTDTIPKSKTKIDRIDVDKTKDRITITYKDGNSETYTEKEATAKGLISNEGFTNDKKGVAIKPNGPKPLIILDGEKYEGDINDLDPKKIESVNVLKDKPAIDKYGANGKNGVIEITMKNSTKKPAPIYILDGKELSKEEMDKIDPNNIQSINVFKDKSATEKYGEKGKNGVVEITMKKTITFDKVILQDSTVFNKTRNVITHNVTRQSEPIFTQVDEPATFAPGKDAWNKILGSTLIASTPKANGAPKGRYAVLVKFRVNKDGTISDVKPTTNFGYGMEEEAVRVIENSPRWAPAKQNGRIVNSENIQPVIFVVGDGVDKL